jgi:hypothetical protein
MELEQEFGGQPRVEFTCVLPMVGPAPCVLDNDGVIRQVTVTFTNHEVPQEIPLEEQARRVVALSFHASDFVKNSDEMDVIFEITERGTFAIASRSSKYSFAGESLAAAAAAAGIPSVAGEAQEE